MRSDRVTQPYRRRSVLVLLSLLQTRLHEYDLCSLYILSNADDENNAAAPASVRARIGLRDTALFAHRLIEWRSLPGARGIARKIISLGTVGH